MCPLNRGFIVLRTPESANFSYGIRSLGLWKLSSRNPESRKQLESDSVRPEGTPFSPNFPAISVRNQMERTISVWPDPIIWEDL